MLTKQQKAKQMEEGEKLLEKSHGLIFIDFTGISVEKLRKLRRSLKELGAKLKVVKKKLLRIVFQNKKIDFNPEQFDSQVGTIFIENDITEIAGPVYKSNISILGAYDLLAKNFLDAQTIINTFRANPNKYFSFHLGGSIFLHT